jgi:hypothetical protein
MNLLLRLFGTTVLVRNVNAVDEVTVLVECVNDPAVDDGSRRLSNFVHQVKSGGHSHLLQRLFLWAENADVGHVFSYFCSSFFRGHAKDEGVCLGEIDSHLHLIGRGSDHLADHRHQILSLQHLQLDQHALAACPTAAPQCEYVLRLLHQSYILVQVFATVIAWKESI